MKKLIAILLALTLLLSVSVCAATINTSTGSEDRPVIATYVEADNATVVYSVDLIWGDMHFNYKEASKGTWDPNNLKYTDSTTEGWYPANTATDSSLASNQVKIVNRSNTDLSCTISFEATSDELTGVKHSFTRVDNSIGNSGWFNLLAATPGNDTTPGTATTEILALHFSGKPNYIPFENVEVGTITIEISS